MNRKNLANAPILSASEGSITLQAGYGDDMPTPPFFATGSQLDQVATSRPPITDRIKEVGQAIKRIF